MRSSHIIHPLLLSLIALLGLPMPSAQAQLDIFEKPQERAPTERRGFTFGTIRLSSQSGRKQMERGSQYYASGNYAAASLQYHTVVSQMAGSRWFQTAQYQLAKALYRMGLHHAALEYFTQIIQTGTGHRHFRTSISWVILISKQLKNESMFLGKLTNFRPSDVPNKYRNELFYLLGKYYFLSDKLAAEKKFKLAMRLLRRVEPNSPEYYARARYVMGVIYSIANPDTQNSDANSAASAFRQSITAARRVKDPEIQKNVLELGVIALARIHYAAKHFRAALGYYRLIERNSKRWLDVLFESAWAHLRRGKYGQALGLIHTLNSPYFQNEYYPEVGILQAVSFFERCRFQDVKSIITKYLARYRPLSQSINDFLRRNPTPERMYAALLQLKNQEESSGLDDDPSSQMFQRLLKLTFQDKQMRELFDYLKEIDREIEVVNRAHSAWQSSSLASQLRRQLAQERQAKIVQAGQRARQRFLNASSELSDLLSQALKIQYETIGAEKDLLQSSANQSGSFTMRTRSQRKRQYITVSAPDDYVFWPFQGEYWVDELGYYRYRIRGECSRQ